MSSDIVAVRRQSLRRQLDLLVELRDRVRHERDVDYNAWANALIPLTDRIITELMMLEGTPSEQHIG